MKLIAVNQHGKPFDELDYAAMKLSSGTASYSVCTRDGLPMFGERLSGATDLATQYVAFDWTSRGAA